MVLALSLSPICIHQRHTTEHQGLFIESFLIWLYQKPLASESLVIFCFCVSFQVFLFFFFFSSVTVPKDPNPQWRRVAWSHDCTLLAYADSTGTVRLFDLMGSELFVIPPVTMPVPPL